MIECAGGSPGVNTSGNNGNFVAMSALIVDPGAHFTFDSGSAMRGCLAYRYGMHFPAPDGQAFAGAPFQAGVAATVNDVVFEHDMILGFGTCLQTGAWPRAYANRLRAYDIAADCNTGIDAGGSADSSHYNLIHVWPYAVNTGTGALNTAFNRSGSGLHFHNQNDDTTLDQAMSLGHAPNFSFGSANMNIGRIWSDDAFGTPSTHTGISINSGAGAINIEGLISYSSYNLLSTDDSAVDVRINNAYLRAAADDCLLLKGPGIVQIGHLTTYGCGSFHIDYANPRGRLDIDTFEPGGMASSRRPCPVGIAPGATSDNIEIKRYRPIDASVACAYAGVIADPKIASAARLAVPIGASALEVTGTTAIEAIAGFETGKVLALHFDAVLTVYGNHGGAADIRLGSGGNFVTRAGSTLSLRLDPDGHYHEIGRQY
jgi:hypothetical protein